MIITFEQVNKLLKDWALSTSPVSIEVRTESNNEVDYDFALEDYFIDDLSDERVDIITEQMSNEVPTEDIWDMIYRWYEDYCESKDAQRIAQRLFTDTDKYSDGKHISRARADYMMCVQEGIFDL